MFEMSVCSRCQDDPASFVRVRAGSALPGMPAAAQSAAGDPAEEMKKLIGDCVKEAFTLHWTEVNEELTSRFSGFQTEHSRLFELHSNELLERQEGCVQRQEACVQHQEEMMLSLFGQQRDELLTEIRSTQKVMEASAAQMEASAKAKAKRDDEQTVTPPPSPRPNPAPSGIVGRVSAVIGNSLGAAFAGGQDMSALSSMNGRQSFRNVKTIEERIGEKGGSPAAVKALLEKNRLPLVELFMDDDNILVDAPKEALGEKVSDYLEKSWLLRYSPGIVGFLSNTEGPGSGIVKSRQYLAASTTLIMANMFFIAIQTQYEVDIASGRATGGDMSVYSKIDLAFIGLFFLELNMRLLADRLSFFLSPEKGWNIMDIVFVSADVFSLVTMYLGDGSFAEGGVMDIWRALRGSVRALRLLRATRTLRAFKMLRFNKRARLLVNELTKSIGSLMYIVVILSIVLLFFSVIFMQATADESAYSEGANKELVIYFGSVWSSILALFMTITGGLEWKAMHELLEEANYFYGVMFLIFIFWMMLGLTNVLVAMFVESCFVTVNTLNDDRRAQAASKILAVLQAKVHDSEGEISRDKLSALLNKVSVQETFHLLGIDCGEAKGICELLTSYGNAKVSIQSIARSCARFTRPLKSSDFVALHVAHRRIEHDVYELKEFCDARFTSLDKLLQEWFRQFKSNANQALKVDAPNHISKPSPRNGLIPPHSWETTRGQYGLKPPTKADK